MEGAGICAQLGSEFRGHTGCVQSAEKAVAMCLEAKRRARGFFGGTWWLRPEISNMGKRGQSRHIQQLGVTFLNRTADVAVNQQKSFHSGWIGGVHCGTVGQNPTRENDAAFLVKE